MLEQTFSRSPFSKDVERGLDFVSVLSERPLAISESTLRDTSKEE